MPSTYSPDLRIELIENGQQSGIWGTTTNANLGQIIEQAISGFVEVSVVSANQALTALNGLPDEARCAAVQLTTTTTAAFNVYVPPVPKLYVFRNASAHAATVYTSTVIGNTTAAGVGVTIPAGKSVLLRCDDTNILEQLNQVVGTLDVGGTFNAASNAVVGGSVLVTGSAYLGASEAATISVASPAVVTVALAPYNDTAIRFTTTDTLPAPLNTTTTYYVVNATGTTFNVATSVGGSAINTTAFGSGTHTVTSVSTTSTAPSGTNNTQIATTAFVNAIATTNSPTGVINMWPTNTAPSGYLLCNGNAVSRTDYAALFAVVGTTFGSGDGSTTFNVPNYVNKFPFGASKNISASITGYIGGSFTASAGASCTSGSISGTTLTVAGTITGVFATGQRIEGNATYTITGQLTGTTGGAGTYSLSNTHPGSAATIISAYSNVLTVAAVGFGTVVIGQAISGTGVASGTTVTAFGTGAGGIGTYTTSSYNYVAPSTTVTTTSTTLNVTTVGSGAIAVGQVITGSGISGTVRVVAFVSGTGGTGTYTISAAQVTATGATTISADPFVSVGGTGGAFDASVISHTHTASVTDPGHTHTANMYFYDSASPKTQFRGSYAASFQGTSVPTNSSTTGITVSNSSTGVNGTNANLPPYLGINFIIKT